MTTITQAREAVYQAFNAVWDKATYPMVFDNEAAPEQSASWVRVAVRHLPGQQETLGAPGARKFARKALALVQIFTPRDAGVQGADILSIVARNIFEGKTLSSLRFNSVDVREVGPDPNGPWWNTLVEASFEYDETK